VAVHGPGDLWCEGRYRALNRLCTREWSGVEWSGVERGGGSLPACAKSPQPKIQPSYRILSLLTPTSSPLSPALKPSAPTPNPGA
jgi:hypothetical protein